MTPSEFLVQRFDRIVVDPESLGSSLVERIQSFANENIQFEVATQAEAFGNLKKTMGTKEFAQSKRILFLTPHKGEFFKRCPGARPGLQCCNYFVLNWGQQCDMDCSYCYLQSFINTPYTILYTNTDKAYLELEELYSHSSHTHLRVGTGEVVDSLSLDPLTLNAQKAIRAFRNFPNWTLELKTKSDLIENFLDEEHSGNIVVSWSVNAAEVTRREEHRTASLEKRLTAARKCVDRGFQVAFHLDPLIAHPNWQDGYSDLIRQITNKFRPEEVNVISVGSLRFQPEQRHMMRKRFGNQSLSVSGELFQSRDGKLRYSRALREQMYSHVFNGFKDSSPNWKVFMCMETPETWMNVVGQQPTKGPLKEMFSPKLIREIDKGLSLKT